MQGSTSHGIKFVWIGLALLAAGLLLAACAGGNPVATFKRMAVGTPGKPYLGKTKEEIIACAGKPDSSMMHGESETLIYHYSGAGPTPNAQAAPKAKSEEEQKGGGGLFGGQKHDKSWRCIANLTFENGRLTQITFAPRDAVSPYATKVDPETKKKVPLEQPEPCVFSLPNCPAQ
jgi:hypothetical protein